MSGMSLMYMLGRPLSPIYSLAMHLRATAYRRRVFRTRIMTVPVVSVGNLTMGGTGKTPTVQFLARLLQDHGYRPAIVSRGYGGQARGRINLVSNGSEVLLDAVQAGDEPNLLARTLPGVPVLTGVVRWLPAQEAVNQGADVLLLDDGFQHLSLGRDLDLVLFSADSLAGNSRVFPGGDLREPVAALARASCFLLTGVHDGNRERANRFAALLEERVPGKVVWQAGYAEGGWVTTDAHGQLQAAGPLPDGPAYGFCGIARPDAFRSSLAACGVDTVAFQALADHYRYTESAIERLNRQAAKAGAAYLVTTEKDLVKLAKADLNLPCFGLRRTVAADAAFGRMILDAVAGHAPAQCSHTMVGGERNAANETPSF